MGAPASFILGGPESVPEQALKPQWEITSTNKLWEKEKEEEKGLGKLDLYIRRPSNQSHYVDLI